jgi:putative nucleotidyltransferase with HDIG domain
MQISIKKEWLADLKNWFTNYMCMFQYDEPEIQQNIDLKKDHTMRVCKEILYIGKQLGLNHEELRLAEIIALLHDVGRFEQYARYKTFMDGKSENHAELSIKILEKYGVLDSLDPMIKDIIVRAIKYHNRPSLPREEKETCLFYAKLIRDADKLDIWKVVTDYYNRKNSKKNGAIELGLPDSPGFSEEVLRDLKNKKIVDIKHVRNLNDFKLLQIGWIFDINFEPTLRCIKKRRYLEMIHGVLPKSQEMDSIFTIIQNHCF